MPKDEFDGLPVIDTDESEEITVAVKPDDMQDGDEADRPRTAPDCHCAVAGVRCR